MPIGRYFLCVGSVLLAVLFLADWYLPPPEAGRASSEGDRYNIRIHSSHKWPKAVVFDTTLPTIVPPPVTAAVEAPAPAPKPAHEALAMVTEPETAARPAAVVKPAKPHVRRTRTARAPQSHDMVGFGNDMFAPPTREAFAFRNERSGSRSFWPMSW